MPKVFIGIGSNLGDREGYLAQARKELAAIPGVWDFSSSPVYETEPVDVSGGSFLNAVCTFETGILPRELLRIFQDIESRAGRERKTINAARTLDLDILFYGDQIIQEPGLRVPHPRLHERAFVLVPLCDLAPEFIHPVLKKTVKALRNNLQALKEK